MKEQIKELDVVALLYDLPDRNLVAGQVGTVVGILDEGVFEVEFSDGEGKTYAMLALKEDQWSFAGPKRAATRAVSSGDAPDIPGAGARSTSPESRAM